MIRGAEKGDRVQVVDLSGEPVTSGETKRLSHGGEWHTWDFSQGNTGTVTMVIRSPSYVFVYIEPDPPNTGLACLAPRDLKRLPHDK